MGKTVYQTDRDGIFQGAIGADPSPLEPGVWLIPAGCVETAPPALNPGQIAKWQNGAWVIILSPSPPEVSLAEAQASAITTLLNNTNQFVEYTPDGRIRYDINFKISALLFAQKNGLSASPAPALFAWMQAVQTAYFTTEAEINACITATQVQAIDVSVAWFEARYGTSGSVSADPGITTQQLL